MGNLLSTHLASTVKFPEEALRRSFFSARNPTPGTGIAGLDASTARSATAGSLLSVFNAAEVDNSSNSIVPVRLFLRATSVNTSASDLFFAIYTDVINRWSSGGTAITEVPHYAEATTGWGVPTSDATIYFGNLVTAAASSEKKIWTQEMSTTIGAVDDTFDLWFGDGPSLPVSVTTPTGYFETVSAIVPPVWLGPGASMLFQTWGASQAADNDFEFEFWYLNKPHVA